MGVLPGIELSKTPPGPGVELLTALQAKGRDVYVANGCSYCHTQQVRPLPQDKIFGRPSAPGDFAYQTPELLGSQRTGPDLTNVAVRQPSQVWQYIHLYNPRAVVPQSIMPAFDWMFKVVDQAAPGVTPVPLPKPYAPARGVVIPDDRAEALVAYLLSLKQSTLPGTSGGDRESTMPDTSSIPGAGIAAKAPPAGDHDAAKGRALFTANCAACHQANGEGLPGAFPPLKGNAAVNDDEAATHIHVVLHGLQGANVGGVAYSSPMPAFGGTLSDADIANIINYERSSWGNQGKPVTAEQVAAERAKTKK
jgi:cytochrome c oxidase cbb3-type subunit 2